MPYVQVPFDPHDEPPDAVADGGFSDILFAPLAPEPDEELTPEDEQYFAFHETAASGPTVAGRGWTEPTVSRSEVCVFSGWPRRHVQIGQHCPHGMLDRMDDGQAEEE